MKSLTERIIMHEKLCFAMCLAMHKDPKDAWTATIRVLRSRKKLLHDICRHPPIFRGVGP